MSRGRRRDPRSGGKISHDRGPGTEASQALSGFVLSKLGREPQQVRSGAFEQAELLNSGGENMSTAIAELPAVLRINDTAPALQAETPQGTIHFHDWIGDGWAILFSHPKDFTPVCTTELGYMAGLMPEIARRNTKIVGLSVDPVENHAKWAQDIEETQGHAVTY